MKLLKRILITMAVVGTCAGLICVPMLIVRHNDLVDYTNDVIDAYSKSIMENKKCKTAQKKLVIALLKCQLMREMPYIDPLTPIPRPKKKILAKTVD